jgi:hypothetical protein
MGGKRTKTRLSMAARAGVVVGALLVSGCLGETPQTAAAAIPRPAADDPTPAGIVYVCEGRKQVSVVYARNRASVTHEGKTWRLEYAATDGGFRYFDTVREWTGRDALASLRDVSQRTPIAYNCRPTARTT